MSQCGSPYCKACGSCGEEGCCPPLNCAYQNMVKRKKSRCDYGEDYFNDLAFKYQLCGALEDIIDEHGTEELKLKLKLEYDRLYDEVFAIKVAQQNLAKKDKKVVK